MSTKKIKFVFSGFMLAFIALSYGIQGMDSKIYCELQFPDRKLSEVLLEKATVQNVKETAAQLWNSFYKDQQPKRWNDIKLEGASNFIGKSDSENIIVYEDNASFFWKASKRHILLVNVFEESQKRPLAVFENSTGVVKPIACKLKNTISLAECYVWLKLGSTVQDLKKLGAQELGEKGKNGEPLLSLDTINLSGPAGFIQGHEEAKPIKYADDNALLFPMSSLPNGTLRTIAMGPNFATS